MATVALDPCLNARPIKESGSDAPRLADAASPMKHLIKTIREQPDANAASNAGHVAIHAQPAPLAVVGLVPARARRELLGLRPVAADKVAEINSRGDTTLAKDYAGEIHRVGVDLEQKAVAAVVVLGRDALTRDVLVPLSRSKRSRTTN